MGFIARIAARFAGRRAAPQATIEALRRQLGDALARGDTDTALEHCAAILARDPDDASALYGAGVLRLKRDETEQALAHFARLEESTSGGARTARLVHDAVMDSERAARHEPYVATFSGALVETSYWAVVVGDRLFRRELHGRGIARSPFVRGRMSPDRTRCIVSVPRVPPRITTPCVLLGSDDNYAHWVLRNVLKLALLEDMPLADETRFLVREDLRGWQSEYLELLGIPKERLLPVPNEALIACDRLIVPTMLSFHPRMSQGIAWLRRKIAPLLAPPENANARIYASRREQRKRRVLNEADLESALERIGFEVIVPGEMSVREQIAAFSRARIVVSPHGAALANMVFAPPGAVMVELVSTAIQHMSEMRFLCAAAGLHSEWVISSALAESAEAPDTPAMHRDFGVDVDEVLAAVRRRLAAQEEGFEREERGPLRPPGR